MCSIVDLGALKGKKRNLADNTRLVMLKLSMFSVKIYVLITYDLKRKITKTNGSLTPSRCERTWNNMVIRLNVQN